MPPPRRASSRRLRCRAALSLAQVAIIGAPSMNHTALRAAGRLPEGLTPVARRSIAEARTIFVAAGSMIAGLGARARPFAGSPRLVAHDGLRLITSSQGFRRLLPAAGCRRRDCDEVVEFQVGLTARLRYHATLVASTGFAGAPRPLARMRAGGLAMGLPCSADGTEQAAAASSFWRRRRRYRARSRTRPAVGISATEASDHSRTVRSCLG